MGTPFYSSVKWAKEDNKYNKQLDLEWFWGTVFSDKHIRTNDATAITEAKPTRTRKPRAHLGWSAVVQTSGLNDLQLHRPRNSGPGGPPSTTPKFSEKCAKLAVLELKFMRLEKCALLLINRSVVGAVGPANVHLSPGEKKANIIWVCLEICPKSYGNSKFSLSENHKKQSTERGPSTQLFRQTQLSWCFGDSIVYIPLWMAWRSINPIPPNIKHHIKHPHILWWCQMHVMNHPYIRHGF